MKGLYIHIPFCKTICTYCDFPKMIAKEKVQKEYITYLIEELKDYQNELTDIKSVYIGGGTPNSLSIFNLKRLFTVLEPYLKKAKENTIEINSELLTEEQVRLFQKYNINRVSIGVQTFQPKLIEIIHRHHTKQSVIDSIKMLHQYGIYNINLDMLYGLPGQNIHYLCNDLDILKDLNLKHISYYSLILEEKTILNYQINKKMVVLPDDDLVADMAILVDQKLKEMNFKHYEISNYALEGHESIHNLCYWNTEEYIGVGAGASGYFHSKRYTNYVTLSRYYHQRIESEEVISLNEQKKEFMLLGLRKISGISELEYQQRFQSTIEEDFDLSDLFKMKLIEKDNQYIRIKEDKILLGNLVFEKFVG